MIKQIYDYRDIKLSDSYFGKKIRAGLNAYGTKYDFCRLYTSDSGGYILLYNSSLVADGEFDPEELSLLVKMLSPYMIEMSSVVTLQLDGGYSLEKRALFKGISGDNDVIAENVKQNDLTQKIFPILEKGFDMGEFDLWYTDISHRIRHGVSDIFLYNNTTVTKEFDVDGFVFISRVATAPEARGKGSARNFLYYLCGEYEKQGKSVYLFAREERWSFYESIGFEKIYENPYYERKNGV